MLTSDKFFEQHYVQQTFDHDSHKEPSFAKILVTKVQFLDICVCQIESRLIGFSWRTLLELVWKVFSIGILTNAEAIYLFAGTAKLLKGLGLGSGAQED